MSEEYRIAVVFRADLPEMTRGKAEVQFGHAVDGALSFASERVIYYKTNGCRMKVSLEVPDMDTLEAMIERAKRRSVPFYLVTDAGRTCFNGPTVTCCAFGPMSKTDCNAITRGARMR